MTSIGALASDLLGSRGHFAVDASQQHWRALVAIAGLTCLLYGAICGSWSAHPLQMLYSGTKVPLMLGLTGLLCLPSFYVLNTVLGLRDDFARACRGILCAQATLGLALAALSPVTALAYVSGCSYPGATLTNGAVFLNATVASQWTLARHYRPLVAVNSRHRIALAAWMLLYSFVAIQLAWSLRPFIGSPDIAVTFLRADSWTNAYVDAVNAMRMALGN